jgi:hypothetical protein
MSALMLSLGTSPSDYWRQANKFGAALATLNKICAPLERPYVRLLHQKEACKSGEE